MKKVIVLWMLLMSLFMLTACEHKHVEEVIPGVPATCTEDGLTEGTKCSKCDEILVQQQAIPAGHEWDAGTEITAPTCTEEGSAEFACANCEETKTEVVKALGHKETEWIIDEEANCHKAGARHTECTVCGEVARTETVPATDGTTDGMFCNTCGELAIEVNKIGKTYVAGDGLSVTVKSLTKKEKTGYIAYTIKYTVKNNVPDTKAPPGLFKLVFADGTTESQNGFFNDLYYKESDSRTYTWKVLKSQKVLFVGYDSWESNGFFKPEVSEGGLCWAPP